MYVPISGVLLGRVPLSTHLWDRVCVFTIVKLRNGGMYCA